MSVYKIVKDHDRIMIKKQHPISGSWLVAGGPFKSSKSAKARLRQLHELDDDHFTASIARQVMAKQWDQVVFS